MAVVYTSVSGLLGVTYVRAALIITRPTIQPSYKYFMQ
jgi:hypothetical protein